VEPAAALLRRAPTVAGEEVAEAERRGGSGSDCAVLLSIAMREDLEGIEGMFGGCHGSDRGACIYKEAEMVGVRGLMGVKTFHVLLTKPRSISISKKRCPFQIFDDDDYEKLCRMIYCLITFANPHVVEPFWEIPITYSSLILEKS
jgi:hypothetical protein